jgi:hypothetical protein
MMAMLASLSPRSIAEAFSAVFAILLLTGCSGNELDGFDASGVEPPIQVCAVNPQTIGQAEPIPDFSEGNGCQVHNGYHVTALAHVKFSDMATITCDIADTLANWLNDSVQPHAKAIYGEQVVAIRVMASYSCRGRDNVSGAKLSQHGLGNAIDIGGFTLASGREIVVLTGWEGDANDQAFLRAIRSEACGPFHTVLGPGSDSYHANHIHLDLQQERRGGGPYCH